MEEILKVLDIRKINFLNMKFIDNNGNFKEIRIDYPVETNCCDKEE